MSDDATPLDGPRAEALREAGRLLDAGLIAELITDTNRLSHGVMALAGELAHDRQRRDRELDDLRRRNRIQAVALAASVVVVGLSVAALTIVVLVGGARLTNIAETNRDNLAAQTFSFIDAAFCVAEHGFDNEAIVYECFDKRTAARIAAKEVADRD